jgi:hypothetical protein
MYVHVGVVWISVGYLCTYVGYPHGSTPLRPRARTCHHSRFSFVHISTAALRVSPGTNPFFFGWTF